MISFITYKNIPQQVEIILDEQGVEELISYLEEIKQSKDHLHLTIDTEIDNYPISKKMKDTTLCAKSVKLEYADTSKWRGLQ